MVTRKILFLSAGVLLGCEDGAESGVALTTNSFRASTDSVELAVCSVVESGNELPDRVRETSGLAQSRRDPAVFFTHNDAGNEPDLFMIDQNGAVVGQVRVQGASLQDWEDLEAGPCASGNCLYVGDIGDNDGNRESVTIYEVAEPERSASRSAPARALRARFPDGAQDAEALFILPNGDIYIVTKGRESPIALYRYPAPHRPNEVVTLARVRQLSAEPGDEQDRVTGAAATPDGRWVGIRTYRTLMLYPSAALIGGGATEPIRVDLAPLGEKQGEALVIGNDGTVWLTSEAPNDKESASWGQMKCTLPA